MKTVPGDEDFLFCHVMCLILSDLQCACFIFCVLRSNRMRGIKNKYTVFINVLCVMCAVELTTW